MGQPISTPSGTTIRLSAPINGTTAYLYGVMVDGLVDYYYLEPTSDSREASTFILEDGTGYLYLVDKDGYYPIPTVPYGAPVYASIELSDASLVRANPSTWGQPLVCVPATYAAPFNGNNGVLSCEAPRTDVSSSPPSTLAPLRYFGFCDGHLVLFDDCVDFVANCDAGTGTGAGTGGGNSSPNSTTTSCAPIEGFGYSDLNLGVASSSSSITLSSSKTPQGVVAAPPPATSSANPASGGGGGGSSCSVTVMLHIEQTTTYVPYGYVAPAGAGDGSGGGIAPSANGGAGGLGGGGNYGCTPVTRTVSVQSGGGGAYGSPTVPAVVVET